MPEKSHCDGAGREIKPHTGITFLDNLSAL
jgi:hypothetical protein